MRGRVLILGLPLFAGHLERVLVGLGWDARFMPHPGRSPLGWARLLPLLARADIVYLISSRMERGSPQDILMRVWRRPLVIHWVGTDVRRAVQAHERREISPRIAERAIHWCDATWLAAELATIGVRSEYLPLPVPTIASDAPPLPDSFRALVYLPRQPEYREVFDVDSILRLPADFPEIQFTIVPSPPESLPSPLPANVEALAWVDDMDALYRQTTVHIRLTLHDGMSFMVIEALSRGRHVIWTFPIEGAIHATGYQAVCDALAALYAQHNAGTLTLNTAGRDYAVSHFDLETLTTALDARLRALL